MSIKIVTPSDMLPASSGVTPPIGAMRSGARSTAPNKGDRPMARELEGKVAVVTGAASGIALASTEAMLAGGSRVVMVDRDEAALKALCNKHGDAVIPLVIDLLDPKDCAK